MLRTRCPKTISVSLLILHLLASAEGLFESGALERLRSGLGSVVHRDGEQQQQKTTTTTKKTTPFETNGGNRQTLSGQQSSDGNASLLNNQQTTITFPVQIQILGTSSFHHESTTQPTLPAATVVLGKEKSVGEQLEEGGKDWLRGLGDRGRSWFGGLGEHGQRLLEGIGGTTAGTQQQSTTPGTVLGGEGAQRPSSAALPNPPLFPSVSPTKAQQTTTTTSAPMTSSASQSHTIAPPELEHNKQMGHLPQTERPTSAAPNPALFPPGSAALTGAPGTASASVVSSSGQPQTIGPTSPPPEREHNQQTTTAGGPLPLGELSSAAQNFPSSATISLTLPLFSQSTKAFASSVGLDTTTGLVSPPKVVQSDTNSPSLASQISPWQRQNGGNGLTATRTTPPMQSAFPSLGNRTTKGGQQNANRNPVSAATSSIQPSPNWMLSNGTEQRQKTTQQRASKAFTSLSAEFAQTEKTTASPIGGAATNFPTNDPQHLPTDQPRWRNFSQEKTHAATTLPSVPTTPPKQQMIAAQSNQSQATDSPSAIGQSATANLESLLSTPAAQQEQLLPTAPSAPHGQNQTQMDQQHPQQQFPWQNPPSTTQFSPFSETSSRANASTSRSPFGVSVRQNVSEQQRMQWSEPNVPKDGLTGVPSMNGRTQSAVTVIWQGETNTQLPPIISPSQQPNATANVSTPLAEGQRPSGRPNNGSTVLPSSQEQLKNFPTPEANLAFVGHEGLATGQMEQPSNGTQPPPLQEKERSQNPSRGGQSQIMAGNAQQNQLSGGDSLNQTSASSAQPVIGQNAEIEREEGENKKATSQHRPETPTNGSNSEQGPDGESVKQVKTHPLGQSEAESEGSGGEGAGEGLQEKGKDWLRGLGDRGRSWFGGLGEHGQRLLEGIGGTTAGTQQQNRSTAAPGGGATVTGQEVFGNEVNATNAAGTGLPMGQTGGQFGHQVQSVTPPFSPTEAVAGNTTGLDSTQQPVPPTFPTALTFPTRPLTTASTTTAKPVTLDPVVEKKLESVGAPDIIRQLVPPKPPPLPEPAKQVIEDKCAGGKCLAQKPEFVQMKVEVEKQTEVVEQKLNPGKSVAQVKQEVKVRIEKTFELKREMLKSAGLEGTVEPANDGVFQHDLLLTEQQANELIAELARMRRGGAARNKRAGNAVFTENTNVQRWPMGAPIQFAFDATLAAEDKQAVRQALNEIQSKTCLKFAERAQKPTGSHLYYTKIANPQFCGLSYVGRIEPANPIYLSFMCGNPAGIAIHETLHALGFQHEQLRYDRDQFITVQWENVNPQQFDFFAVSDVTKFSSYGIKYDYGSIMHYSSTIASANPGKKTMTAKMAPAINDPIMGQRKGLSPSDVDALKKMYCQPDCNDKLVYCGIWANAQLCNANMWRRAVVHQWIIANCQKSCNMCGQKIDQIAINPFG